MRPLDRFSLHSSTLGNPALYEAITGPIHLHGAILQELGQRVAGMCEQGAALQSCHSHDHKVAYPFIRWEKAIKLCRWKYFWKSLRRLMIVCSSKIQRFVQCSYTGKSYFVPRRGSNLITIRIGDTKHTIQILKIPLHSWIFAIGPRLLVDKTTTRAIAIERVTESHGLR